MLTDVLDACVASGCFDIVAAISNDSEVLWHVRERGARAMAEPATVRGLNQSLTFGLRYLARRLAVDELLILPADVPLVRPEDLRAVAEALGTDGIARVAIVRSQDGGTNALALRPPDAIPMRFGPGSADAHLAEASAAGIEAVELAVERLAFDVDVATDVDALASLTLGAATARWRDAWAAEKRAG